MTDAKPKALQLVEESENGDWIVGTGQWREEAATELRRLHEENTALRQAIEQAEKQEPVAWLDVSIDEAYSNSELDEEEKQDLTPLYTAPPKREWVGLTDDEVLTTWLSPDTCKVPQCDKYHHFYVAIEAKLKDKNT
jgi:hypothetical protein